MQPTRPLQPDVDDLIDAINRLGHLPKPDYANYLNRIHGFPPCTGQTPVIPREIQRRLRLFLQQNSPTERILLPTTRNNRQAPVRYAKDQSQDQAKAPPS